MSDIVSLELDNSRSNPELNRTINRIILSTENGFPFNLTIHSFDIPGDEKIKNEKIKKLRSKYEREDNKDKKNKKTKRENSNFNIGSVFESLFPEGFEKEEIIRILSEMEEYLKGPNNKKIIEKFLNQKDKSITLEDALRLSSIFDVVLGKMRAKVMEKTQGQLLSSKGNSANDSSFGVSFEKKEGDLFIKVEDIENFQESGSVFGIPLKDYQYLTEVTKFGFGPFREVVSYLLRDN